MLQVAIVPLGAVAERVSLSSLTDLLNKSQQHYRFFVSEEIPILGNPEHQPKPGSSTAKAQFSAEQLFSLLKSYHLPTWHIHAVVGIVDEFIFDELFSVVDIENKFILVSIKANNVYAIWRAAEREAHHYVLTEVAAQLLCLEYRRRFDKHIPPLECGAPWHEQRRGCIFDYYGIAIDDIRKFMSPRICDQCLEELRSRNVSELAIIACKEMLNKGLKQPFGAFFLRQILNPYFTLIAGAWLGAIFGTFLGKKCVLMFVTLALALTWTTYLVIQRHKDHPSRLLK